MNIGQTILFGYIFVHIFKQTLIVSNIYLCAIEN